MKVLILLVLLCLLLPQTLTQPTVSAKDRENLVFIHNSQGIDWRLVKAVAIVESKLNHKAKGHIGITSYGLMQLGAWHARVHKIKIIDLYNPSINVRIGSKYLRDMIVKYGFKEGIQIYSLGETKYAKGKRNIRYYNKVLKAYRSIDI
jgi:soluble lytic murein transglycosylase-like protein